MKGPKGISTDQYTRLSVIQRSHISGTPERLIGIKLTPLMARAKVNYTPNILQPDPVTLPPQVSPNILHPKNYLNPLNQKTASLIPHPKLPSPFERNKNLPKRSYLDTSIDAPFDEKDITILMPPTKQGHKS